MEGLKFAAFPANEYDEVFLGYQPRQMVERWKNQRFEDHLCPRPQGAGPLNHLTRLIARENIIKMEG
jgi:hypothetical protein